ncbi:uncharacterized protein FIBRA_05133 [Fibroporia radiculosa]|uniref:Uncharacterized protein n=1 Tax=Fibroporia radiculosa TaxID=599839 RepID=J4IAJ4_9APHY|nr:uncharacterized protein FIBRA_05133 [Fibroporia radiculosa]CCM03016.1 predicted protein [Fibroporia radiculosa]
MLARFEESKQDDLARFERRTLQVEKELTDLQWRELANEVARALKGLYGLDLAEMFWKNRQPC